MNIDDEEKKIADQAAGQRAFVKAEIPVPYVIDPQKDPDVLKRQLLALCVNSYIDDAEKEKKRLLGVVEIEQLKNRDIKDIAERLAMEVERLSPGHQFAAEVLALLLENKMMTDQSPRKKK